MATDEEILAGLSEGVDLYKDATPEHKLPEFDAFDLLIREAMFASLDFRDISARQNTFTTSPRGIRGPFKTVLG